MAEDFSNDEGPRVILSKVSRDKAVMTGGNRVRELPNDRKPETIGTPRADRPQIFIADEVYGQVIRHFAADLRYERGGALLGYRNQTPQGQNYAEVTGFSPATHGAASPISIQFDQDDWADFHADTERRGKGERVIGWVHSHPHHLPAPSPQDFFIMKGYIQEIPEQFTLIVNPNTNQIGIFRWEGETSVNQGGFVLYGDLPSHGLTIRPTVVRTNSLNEKEDSSERKESRVKVGSKIKILPPDTFWQRARRWIKNMGRS